MFVYYSSIWCESRITTCASHQFRRHHSDEIGIAFGRWARNWDLHRLRRKEKQSFCSVNTCVFGHPSTVTSAVDYRHLKKFFFTFDDTKHGLLKKMKGLQKYIVSPYGGSLNNSGIQHERFRARNGKKYEISAILRKGGSCWC